MGGVLMMVCVCVCEVASFVRGNCAYLFPESPSYLQ